MRYIFTSESVTKGHPDKICDIISDLILDTALSQDPDSKMAVETTIKDNFILIYGEQNTKAIIDFEHIARKTLKDIGYHEDYEVLVKVSNQSMEISNAVESNPEKIGAGDQGIMFGFACNDTETYMPLPIYYAHKLAEKLDKVQVENAFLGPDGKTQVSIEYHDDKPVTISTIIISTQHQAGIPQEYIEEVVTKQVIHKVIDNKYITNNTRILINPSGSFVVGGSFGDSGTTGRKIVCDTYGGMGRIGGGCLSSKDPTKVDRSGAYFARYVAKNIVANGLANKCEIQVSYAIGQSEPVSLFINTFGTETIEVNKIKELIDKTFNFSVENIISELDLKRPIYFQTSCYGHFGKSNLPWEKIIKLKL